MAEKIVRPILTYADEGHRMSQGQLRPLVRTAKKMGIPVVFSYDQESAIAPSERKLSRVEDIESQRGFVRYTLTNRIRMNVELSSFIAFIMKPDMQKRRKEYPNIHVCYSGTARETGIFLKEYKRKGFIYIRSGERDADPENTGREIEASLATCKEFERIVMVIDSSFSYDADGYLVSCATLSGDQGSHAAASCVEPHSLSTASDGDQGSHAAASCVEPRSLSTASDGDQGSHAAASCVMYRGRTVTDGGSRHGQSTLPDSGVRMLFHGLSRSKSEIALIIEKNKPVFETVMSGLQGE